MVIFVASVFEGKFSSLTFWMFFFWVGVVLGLKKEGIKIVPVLIGIIKGSLEVKLPTIWRDEKQRTEESESRK